MALVDLDAGHVPEAARVLARAFVDNPGVRAVLDRHSSEARRTVFERISRGFVRATRRYGSVTALLEQDRVAAVMLVYPPAAYPVPLIGQLLMATPVLASGPRAAWKFSRLAGYMRGAHLRTRHYYLFMIGVDPHDQHKGHGGTLLRHLNQLADKAGADCYLETDKHESVSLYEHVGYRITRDDTIAALGNLRMWTMKRPPR